MFQPLLIKQSSTSKMAILPLGEEGFLARTLLATDLHS
jgi:hypothetical protein